MRLIFLVGCAVAGMASAVMAEENTIIDDGKPHYVEGLKPSDLCTKENDFCQGFEMSITPQATITHTIDTLIDTLIGIQMQGVGKPVEAKFFSFELTKGANAMLHGYVPHEGDTVEWYVRDVKCDDPDKACSFELAIRKRYKMWPFF